MMEILFLEFSIENMAEEIVIKTRVSLTKKPEEMSSDDRLQVSNLLLRYLHDDLIRTKQENQQYRQYQCCLCQLFQSPLKQCNRCQKNVCHDCYHRRLRLFIGINGKINAYCHECIDPS